MGKENLVDNGSGQFSQKPKATFSLIMGVAMAVIGSSFQYGYNIAVVNAPADEIKDYFFGPYKTVVVINTTTPVYNYTTAITSLNSTQFPVTESVIGTETIIVDEDHKDYRDNMYAIAVSAFAASGMVGSILVGPVVKRFGRCGGLRVSWLKMASKEIFNGLPRCGGLMVNNVISLIAAVFLGFSKLANSFVMIIIGRVFIGVFAGLATGIVPMYISEISPKEWRGAIGVLNQLLITIGILVAQLLGLQGALGTPELWPILLGFTAIPSIIQIIARPFMPKSPRYLLIDQHKSDEARNTLVKLRGTDNIANEMDEMQNEADSEISVGQMSIAQLFKDHTVRWQLIIVLSIMVAQQLSGINAVFFYTNEIFESAKIPAGNQQDLASVGVGVVNVLMTIVSVGVIEWAGRKSLLVWGFGMMIFWCIAMTVVLNLLQTITVTWISYLSIACVIGYIVGFAIGPGPVPWLVTAELFRQAARPPAFMIACLLNWTCNFLIGIGFPAVNKATGPYVFLIFMVVCIAITIFLSLVMPETKGKTFQEINNLFAKRNGVRESSPNNDKSMRIPLKDFGNEAGDRV